ncbi:MAG: hypothetical protein EOS65_31350, partial [Mesorhizobium sp.]
QNAPLSLHIFTACRPWRNQLQSGETDVTGGISKAGDMMVRSALFEAATVLFFRLKLPSNLKDWAPNVAKRRGTKRAIGGLTGGAHYGDRS